LRQALAGHRSGDVGPRAGWTPTHQAPQSGMGDSIKSLMKSAGQADSEKSSVADPTVLALRITNDAAFRASTAVVTAASPEDLPTIDGTNEQLLVLAILRDIDPRQMAKFRSATQQGVADALTAYV
jgi:hypothetical protein